MSNVDAKYRLDTVAGIDGLDDFDVAECLSGDEAIAAYLSDVISTGNQALINEAVRNVIRAKGVAAVAEEAGVSREGTYKALRPSRKPRFETIAALLDALGLEIKIVPKSTPASS